MKNKMTILSMLMFAVLQLFSQETIQSAFSKSYGYEKVGNYTSAISVLKTIYTTDNYETNIRIGYLLFEAGMYDESIKYYNIATNLRPNSIEAKLGFVLPASSANKWDAVIKQYEEILKIEPNNSSVNYWLGLIYYNRKNYTVAYKNFEKVTTLYPFDYDGLHMFAWCNLNVKKNNEAKELFNRVLLLSPGDKSALEGLSLLK
jgi:tetratricopeptide (TPR) repeat protein